MSTITAEQPLGERVAWLLGNGVKRFDVGIAWDGGKAHGAIVFHCSDCPELHVLEVFPSEAEANVALELALNDAGRKVQDGGAWPPPVSD